MKKKRQIALNKLFNFSFLFGIFLAFVSAYLFSVKEIWWGVGVGTAALLTVFLSALFTPFCYSFDSEGVTLCYLFLPNERYLWKDIRAIEVEDKSVSVDTSIIDFFFANVFSIKGKCVGKCRIYMNGHIRKSFRTKRLLEKFWDGTITGYLFEDVTNYFKKQKNKRKTQINAHFTDEVVKMEREIRAEMRELLKPCLEKAKEYNLSFKPNYFYITKDFKELNSRPNEAYTYTLIAEISNLNETDQDRIVVASVDLLYVRLGKTAFRGVKNQHIKEEIEYTLQDALKEINKNGIEAYCKGK